MTKEEYNQLDLLLTKMGEEVGTPRVMLVREHAPNVYALAGFNPDGERLFFAESKSIEGAVEKAKELQITPHSEVTTDNKIN